MNPRPATPAKADPILSLDLAPDLRIVAHVRSQEQVVDLRLWRRSPTALRDDANAYQPTAAGFRVPFDRVSEVRAILRAALETAP